MDKIVIRQVWHAAVDRVWNQLRPRFIKAVEEHGGHWGHTWDTIYAELKESRAILHMVREGDEALAFFVTELVHAGNKSSLRIVFLEGTEMDRWLEQGMRYIQALGHRYVVDDVELYGRRGWERVLAPHGFEFAFICLRKPLWAEEKRKKS